MGWRGAPWRGMGWFWEVDAEGPNPSLLSYMLLSCVNYPVDFLPLTTRPHAPHKQVMATLPLICLCFPIDAAASIMDGSLLAAKQSNYMSAVQVGERVRVCFVGGGETAR